MLLLGEIFCEMYWLWKVAIIFFYAKLHYGKNALGKNTAQRPHTRTDLGYYEISFNKLSIFVSK